MELKIDTQTNFGMYILKINKPNILWGGAERVSDDIITNYQQHPHIPTLLRPSFGP